MKRLVDFYLKYQDCTSRREWKCWPFHKIYNQYKEKNGGVTCVDKWRELVNANIHELKAIADFETLHNALLQLSGNKGNKYRRVYGIGPLHIYDTAICLKQPTIVYLHSGTKKAANAMGIYGPTAELSDFVAKFPELDKLTPLQLEDFLCIYKEVFIGNKTIDAQLEELPKCCNCITGVNCSC